MRKAKNYENFTCKLDKKVSDILTQLSEDTSLSKTVIVEKAIKNYADNYQAENGKSQKVITEPALNMITNNVNLMKISKVLNTRNDIKVHPIQNPDTGVLTGLSYIHPTGEEVLLDTNYIGMFSFTGYKVVVKTWGKEEVCLDNGSVEEAAEKFWKLIDALNNKKQ